MHRKDYHKVLGLDPGAGEKQIKTAYRKLALKYHPDRNPSPEAAQKFQSITEAYNYLLDHPGTGLHDAESYDDRVAEAVLKKERERMQQQARARREKKKQQEEYFKRPEWHDPILLLRYLANYILLLLGLAAIIFPILLAIFSDPESLAGTAIILIMGGILLVYIYQKRRTWFRLGKFNITGKELVNFFRLQAGKPSKDKCCYCRSTMADGTPNRIELLKTLEIKIISRGALNHEARYKNRVKRVVVPRSARAAYYHRLASVIKVIALLGCLLFSPLDSILWSLMAGLACGGCISGIMLLLARVRSKVAYLLTPGLVIKLAIWIISLSLISHFGPGFNIQISGFVYLVMAGLLFFLDMVFDLLFGFFPFYHRMFRPIRRQGTILDALYKDGYQNYQEFPVISMVFPFIKWLF